MTLRSRRFRLQRGDRQLLHRDERQGHVELLGDRLVAEVLRPLRANPAASVVCVAFAD